MPKRVFDIAVASLVTLIISPLLAIIAAAVFIDSSGTIIFRATRVGKGGRLFEMYKFRTMNGDSYDGGPRVTAGDDPRITRLGKLLRCTKLNELPQLFNVIKGDMSLVGPRPEDPEFVRHYSAIEAEILSVKPGITSPASVIYYDEERLLSFANATDSYIREIMPRKLRLDLQYVRHHSFLLDLDVLFQTFLSLLPKIRSAVPEIDVMLFGPLQKLVIKYIPWFVVDWVVGFAGLALAGTIWRQRMVLNVGVWPSFLAGLFLASIFSLVNWMAGLHRIVWRRASNADAVSVALSASAASALLVIANKWMLGFQIFPSGMILLGCFFALNGFIAMRYWRVVVYGLVPQRVLENGRNGHRKNVIIVGAGEMAAFVLRSLSYDPQGKNYNPVGFVDDDPMKRGARIRGIKVLGPSRRLPQLVQDHNVALLLVAMHDLDAAEQGEVLHNCEQSGAKVVEVPDIVTSLYADMSAETPRVRAFAASR
jgi:lipopolysaccharide/colanic/teichoic acid biosynthesis glycosyltransferase